MITGADGLRIGRGDRDEDEDEGGGGASATVGNGGATAGPGPTTTGAGGGSTTTTAASTTTGPDPCTYPTGPYGVAVNQTVPPSLTWQGYSPGASSPGTVSIQELFDCDGSKGIDAILFDTSQYG
jgi:hypothetical protein